ncbi:MAG: UbiA family prenyltransferase [Euryarchaeota archaeon]|nr:UbiA family prenyltransferase [Euryarchaeota archaeon]MBU4492015.1 UbiA family prenyltransferase [Euryarchaeota archaeon]MCG2727030.1 UbiA family prenyltransferase [Candidatus Methanoperedenaceae archaeon]
MIHSGCDIINDIYDIEIDKICKPNGAIASGQISLKNAWIYMMSLFSTALVLSLNLSPILFACFLTGIIIGGIMYSHPLFRFKDKPGIAMADMAFCFALESIGVWSIYSPVNSDSLLVAAYIFVLVFSLTFMKDFKDVAGDVNSLPLLLGIRQAARVCSVLTLLPLFPLIYAVTKYHYLALAAVIYAVLIAGCIKILMGNPVAEGNQLKDRMILALTVPNFTMLLLKMVISL